MKIGDDVWMKDNPGRYAIYPATLGGFHVCRDSERLETKETLPEALEYASKHAIDIKISEMVSDLRRCVEPGELVEFLDACTTFAQIGMQSDDLHRIVHAMMHSRILAFGFGGIEDVGERGIGPDLRTRGSKSYIKEGKS